MHDGEIVQQLRGIRIFYEKLLEFPLKAFSILRQLRAQQIPEEPRLFSTRLASFSGFKNQLFLAEQSFAFTWTKDGRRGVSL
jgi:hypothetical protein